jgi:hypothetical protein
VSEGGSRFGIVLNGSPLFTGGAGSGESDVLSHQTWEEVAPIWEELVGGRGRARGMQGGCRGAAGGQTMTTVPVAVLRRQMLVMDAYSGR